MKERYNKVVVVAVPEKSKREVLLGIENGDPISQLILKSDLDMIRESLELSGVLNLWDTPLITLHGNSEMDCDAPDRNGKVFAAADNLDGTVRAVKELEEFVISVDFDIEDSIN